MKRALCPISSNAEVMPGIHLMWIEAPDIAAMAQPGQFITVRCGDFTLRRPFSVQQVGSNNVIASHLSTKDRLAGAKQSQVAILFNVTGKGTLWLSQRKAGERIDILGPLGKGFTIAPESRNLLLVAGGIGLAPLVFLMQQTSVQHQITLIHGARTAAQLCYDSCQPPAISHQRVRLIPVTEDGSAGQKGKATDVLPDYLDWADQVYACGPVDMYKAMTDMSLRAERGNLKLKGEEKPIVGEGPVPSHSLKLKKCQISLEVRMGCGFGACYCCTINTKKGLRQVCRNGPVFELDDIIWHEVSL
jgi:dihydroorotate dehydrogenase electron transfer subunit